MYHYWFRVHIQKRLGTEDLVGHPWSICSRSPPLFTCSIHLYGLSSDNAGHKKMTVTIQVYSKRAANLK